MRRAALLALLALAFAARPAPAEDPPPDPNALVREWVARLRRLERVHAGGRQRVAMQRDAARLLPPMIEAMRDEKTHVGRSLAQIAALAPPRVALPLLTKGLEHRVAYVREFCADALGRLGSPPAVPRLLAALWKGRVSYEAGFGAIVAIGGEEARDALIARLPGSSKDFRQGVAEALGHFPDEPTVAALTRAVGDRIDIVAAQAMRSLARLAERGSHGGDATVEAIAKRLESKSPELRAAAMEALGVLGGDTAYDALVSHARRHRDESFEAWEAATHARDRPPPAPAIVVLVRELETGDDDDRRRRAARALVKATDEGSAAALHAVVEDPDAPLALVRDAVEVLVRRGEAVDPAAIRRRVSGRADGRSELVTTLDRAGAREDLRKLAFAGGYGVDDPPGGPFFFLVFHGEPSDVPKILDLAERNAHRPAALADLHLALLAIGGAETVDALVSALPLMDADDRVETPYGFKYGRRAWCAMTLRALTGRTFGYASDQASGTNRDAFRDALRWWRREGRKREPATWVEGAADAARAHLTAKSAERRENAVVALAREGALDALAEHLGREKDPAVAMATARALASADDVRGVEWLVAHLADESLADPLVGSTARPTRLEAIRTLRRVAQVAFDYEDGRTYDREEAIDVVTDEAAAWRRWWLAARRASPAAWRAERWKALGFDLAAEPSASVLRRLAGLLDAPGVPRWRREGALVELRRLTGKRVLPVDLPTLGSFAPGNDHPVFGWLAPRWRDLVDTE